MANVTICDRCKKVMKDGAAQVLTLSLKDRNAQQPAEHKLELCAECAKIVDVTIKTRITLEVKQTRKHKV